MAPAVSTHRITMGVAGAFAAALLVEGVSGAVVGGGAMRGTANGRIEPKLVPKDDGVFFKKDYPHDLSPLPRHEFDHPFPIIQDSEDYDSDFVKDENADGGAWKIQEDYDRLRATLAASRNAAKVAKSQTSRQERELKALREKQRELREKRAATEAAKNKADSDSAAKVKAAEDNYNKAKGAHKAHAGNGTGVDAVDKYEDKVAEEKEDMKTCEEELEEAKEKLEKLKAAQAEAEKKEAEAVAAEKEAEELEKRLERAEADAAKAVKGSESSYKSAKKEADKKEEELEEAEDDLDEAGTKLRDFRSPPPAKKSAAMPGATASSVTLAALVAGLGLLQLAASA